MTYDETAAVTALGVAPTDGTDGHGIERIFTIRQRGIRLRLAVHQYDSDAIVEVFRDPGEECLFRAQVKRFSTFELREDSPGAEFLEISRSMGDGVQRVQIWGRPEVRVIVQHEIG